MHDFSVWLINGSNPADINWFRSHTGNLITHSRLKPLHFINKRTKIPQPVDCSVINSYKLWKNSMTLNFFMNLVRLYTAAANFALYFSWHIELSSCISIFIHYSNGLNKNTFIYALVETKQNIVFRFLNRGRWVVNFKTKLGLEFILHNESIMT